jgi:hypothetical protein
MQRTQSVGRADTIEVPVEPTTGDPTGTGGKRGRKGKKNGKNGDILTHSVSLRTKWRAAVEAKKPAFEDFGMLGRNGISAGTFLASPYAVNSSVPDIQLTLYPTVRTAWQMVACNCLLCGVLNRTVLHCTGARKVRRCAHSRPPLRTQTYRMGLLPTGV